MNFFHADLKKEFKKQFKPNIFNIFINIDLSYLRELEEKGLSDIVFKVKYDINFGISGYEIILYGEVLNKKSSNRQDDDLFTVILNENTGQKEIIILKKKELIYYPVKKLLRKYKINKILNV